MDQAIINRTAPLAGQLSRTLIRPGQGRSKGQSLLQGWTQLLVWSQTPLLPNRTAPMLVLRVLAMPDLQLNYSHHCPQLHFALPSVMRFSTAEGEKLRLGGSFPVVTSVLSADASIRVLLPAPLSLARATSAAVFYHPSSRSFLRFAGFVFADEEPIITLLLWWQCQDAPNFTPPSSRIPGSEKSAAMEKL